MFSSEFCEISKNTFFYITPLVAASVDIEICIGVSKIEQMIFEFLIFYGLISRAFRWGEKMQLIKKRP